MYRIGVDLGGTNIAAGLVDDDGKIKASKSIKFVTRNNHEDLAADIAGLCKDLMQIGGVGSAQIHSVGLGSPGTIDPPNGTIIKAHNLNIVNMPASHLIGRVLNLPVYVENDANCAALGEAAFGAARGAKNSITITLGTGIGCGIIIDSKIYSGTFFGAGEAHFVIRADGKMCTCGLRGCWEEYGSARGLVSEATQRQYRLDESQILKLVGDIKNITPKIIFEAADLGDNLAIFAIENYIDNLCLGLGALINILQPEIIVIGGGLSGRGQTLVNHINCRLPDVVYARDVRTKIVLAALGNDAGIIGAAMLDK